MLSDNIKRIAKEKNIPLYKIEKEVGLAEGSLSKWKDSKPSYDKVLAVADVLGVSFGDLTKEG